MHVTPSSAGKRHNGLFLLQFLRMPGTTGAVTPSSAGLAERMMEWLDLTNAKAVLEYGPGTGVFSEAFLARRAPGTRFFMIELNPKFVEIVRGRFPKETVYQDSLVNVRKLCDREGIDQVDCIFSGLPWASFPKRLQTDILDAMMTVLRPGGQFVTFAYITGFWLPPGMHFRKNLDTYFSEVECSRTVWKNVPPAFVYRCRR